jgi:signal peptidase I
VFSVPVAPRRPLRPARPRGWGTSALVLLGVAFVALLLRSLVAMPRTIPSESMLPGLVVGDSVVVTKWPYGWSRFSLPGVWPGLRGRLLGAVPARGDVVVFRAPPTDRQDYVKRVIGLPGDVVAMRAGRLWLNGRLMPRRRIADFVLPLTPSVPCMTIAALPRGYGRVTDRTGRPVCRLPRYREDLPGGRSHEMIDQGRSAGDELAPTRVPAGHLFLLGDNRDLSDDSRFPVADGGIGMVPFDNLEGRAAAIFLSADGWMSGLRPARIGGAVR